MASFSFKSDDSKTYDIRPLKSSEAIAALQLISNRNVYIFRFFWIVFSIFGIVSSLLVLYLAIDFLLIPAWEYISTYGLEFKFIISLLGSSLLFIPGVFYYIFLIFYFYKIVNPDDCLVAIHNEQFVGFVSLIKLGNKNKLAQLFVKEGYRQQGIGSSLVREIAKNIRQSIYVGSLPETISFYTRLGFKPREYKSIRKWIPQGDLTRELVLEPNCISSINIDRDLNSEKQDRYYFRQAKFKDIKTIATFISSLSPATQDSLLSFGFSYLLPLQLPLLILLFILIAGYAPILIAFIINYPPLFSLLALIFLAASLSIGIFCVKPLTHYIIKKNISCFWLMEESDLLIGYIRFKEYRNYGAIEHLSYLPSYEIEIIKPLIDRLIHKEQQDIYVACSRKIAKTYYQHNFIKIEPEKLPKKLKLGGKLCSWFGGVNLVHSQADKL